MFGVVSRFKVGIWAALCALTALVALAGLFLGLPALAALGPEFMPMSPGAAWLSLAFAGALFLAGYGPRSLPARAAILLMAGLEGGSLLYFLLIRRAHQGASLATIGFLVACFALAMAAGFRARPWRARQVASLAALVPLGVGCLVVFSYAAGVPLLYEAQAQPTSLPTALCLFLVGHGLLALSGNDVFPMTLFRLDRAEMPLASGKWMNRLPLLSFILLATAGGAAGALFLKAQAAADLRLGQSRLADVADFKAGILDRWVEERTGDAEIIRRSGLLQEQLALRLAGKGTSDRALGTWMASLRDLYGYECVALCDAAGRRVLAEGIDPEDPGQLQHAGPFRQALATRAVTLVDLHRDPGEEAMHFGFWIPILGPEGAAVGAVNLKMDAGNFLIPFLQDWPGPRPRGQSRLVRRESGEGIPLGPGEARVPLGGIASGGGRRDLVVGRTRLRNRVFESIRPVKGTPWALVLDLRESEVIALERPRFWATAMATLGIVLLLALGTGFLMRRYGGLRIREKLELERERKVLAERSKVLMQEANDIILLLDLEGRVLDANARALASYGYSLEEMAGMTGRDMRTPDTAGDFEAKWEWLKARGSGVWETFHRRKDGTVFPVEASCKVVSLGGATYVISFLRDISERHAQAREIRHLTQLYAALGQVGQAVVWTRGRAELFHRICDVLVEFGRLKTAWIGTVNPATGAVTLVSWHGAEDHLGHFAAAAGVNPLEVVIAGGKPLILDGAERGTAESAAAFPIAQAGTVTHILGVVARDAGFFGAGEVELLEETALDLAFALDKHDEEARRAKAEEELLSAEEFTENLIQTANAIIVCLDQEGNIVLLNEAATDITGYSREELQGRNWFETIVPRERYPEVWDVFAAMVQGGVPRRFENPILTKDGKEKYISWQNSDVRQGGRVTGTISFGIETTQQRLAAEEQKRLEAQLQQSQKMESLGSLAGGVAHDLNNVLGAILSLSSAHREDPGLPPGVGSALGTIVTACLRGRGVIKSLLYFARKDLEEEHPLDLNGLVRDIAQLLAHTTLKRVALVLDLAEGLPQVLGDAGALSHALMNLCVNAVDAMPGGGTLLLRTRRDPEGGLVLSVVDDGEGMTEAVLGKAMEPFFTTKPLGKGTGLGLSMVFGTMKAHGGSLELSSRAGEGTEAQLRFPASRVQPEPAAGAPSAPLAQAGSALSILLVDDDELIRESVGPMLEILGHDVKLASGGQEALDLLGQGLAVDLVILDMNMPGLTGAQVLPRILALNPRQRVLMASGYSDQDVNQLLEGRPGVRTLRKPFSLAEIRAVLEAI